MKHMDSMVPLRQALVFFQGLDNVSATNNIQEHQDTLRFHDLLDIIPSEWVVHGL